MTPSWEHSRVVARPFRHIVAEAFLPPETIAAAAAEFPPPESELWYREGGRHQVKWSCNRLAHLPPDGAIASIVVMMNHPAVVARIGEALGIAEPLEDDAWLEGGGMHMIPRGGFLGMHVDFNYHPRDKELHRRVNVLLYLNDPWKPKWGGALELWDFNSRRREVEYLPIAGRMIAFGTTETSLHGHPEPLRCPEGQFRRSLAFYYYSRTRPAAEIARRHNTRYRR